MLILCGAVKSTVPHPNNEKSKQFCPNLEVRKAIEKGYEKLRSYYAKTDDSFVYLIVTSK